MTAKLQPPLLIAVDFDGCLCEHAYPYIGAPKRGAKEALSTFRKLGYKVVIYSCRTSHFHYEIFGGDRNQPTLERERVKEMITWLDDNGFEYDEVDDGSRGKILASLYLDDKAMRVEDNWQQISEWVNERRPV